MRMWIRKQQNQNCHFSSFSNSLWHPMSRHFMLPSEHRRPARETAFSIWHLAFGIWHLGLWIWHRAFGHLCIWHLASVHLAFGICAFGIRHLLFCAVGIEHLCIRRLALAYVHLAFCIWCFGIWGIDITCCRTNFRTSCLSSPTLRAA